MQIVDYNTCSHMGHDHVFETVNKYMMAVESKLRIWIRLLLCVYAFVVYRVKVNLTLNDLRTRIIHLKSIIISSYT